MKMFSSLRPQVLVVAVLSGSLFVGCGTSTGEGGGSSSPPVLVGIEVKPNSAILSVGDSGKQFAAEPKDSAGNTINGEEIFWEIVNNDGRKGSVNGTGWYRPPTVLPDTSNVVMVKAFSRNNPEKNGFASVSLLTSGRLAFGGNTRIVPHATGDDGYAFSGQDVAVLDQTVYTVWADNPNGTSGNYDIYLAKSLDRGRTISCQLRLQLAQDQLSPSIVLDSQGNIYITAYDNSIGGNYGIFFAKGQPNSNNCIDFNQQGVVFSSDTETYFFPSLAIGPDGTVHIAWSWTAVGSSGIYFARGIPNSQTGRIDFGEKVVATHDSTGDSVFENSNVSISSDGNIYIAFSQTLPGSSHIFLAKSVDGGTSFQEIRISDNLAYAFYSAMAVDHAGVIYVVWTDFRSANPKIYLAKSTNESQNFSISNATANVEGEQWLPAISVDQAGSVYLAWENLNSDQDIYFAKSMDGGVNFSDPVRVNSDTGTAAQYSPSLALDSAGRAFILWFDERNACTAAPCPYALYFAIGQ
jgi:hypothetical protein